MHCINGDRLRLHYLCVIIDSIMQKNSIPLRKDVPAKDKWDLSTLYKSDKDWEKALASIPALTRKVASFKGKLASSASVLLDALKALETLDKTIELAANYASLQHCADEGDSKAQDKEGRAMMAYSQAEAAISFFDPEIQAIPDSKISSWIAKDEFKDYAIFLKKLTYLKPHILSEKDERILALQSE